MWEQIFFSLELRGGRKHGMNSGAAAEAGVMKP
jgi:hypothetical protein